MNGVFKSPRILLLAAMLAGSATVSLAAQEPPQDTSDGEVMATVVGTLPSPDQMTKGPKVEGLISARSDGRMQVTTADGNTTSIETLVIAHEGVNVK